MNQKLLLFIFLTFSLNFAIAQSPAYKQYFDGADTSANHSILIQLDTSSANVWQIGRPQKSIFDSAATNPNVLMTDTVNSYPANLNSSFKFEVGYQLFNISVLAIRWKQKLDFDTVADGGIVEFSVDSGANWVNIFHSNDVYNLYGFDTSNVDTLITGKKGFTGTDSIWRDIWLCFKRPFLTGNRHILFRFTAISDSVDNGKEGWMIDNMLTQETYFHTVSTIDKNKTFLVYPTITSDVVKVSVNDEAGHIDNIVVTDMQGKVISRFNNRVKKTELHLGGLPAGNYLLNIQADNKIEAHKILLSH